MFWRLARWLPAILWMGFIFYWSSQPVLPIDGQPSTDDLHRIAHVIAYATLALLLALAVGTSRRGLLLSLALATLYAASDEWHQSLVPGRKGRLQDVALDVISAGGALLVFAGLRWLLGAGKRGRGGDAGTTPLPYRLTDSGGEL